jgi:multiple sugar transport system ATP-binding protein
MGSEIYLYLNVAKTDDELEDEINVTARVPSRSKTKAGDNTKIAIDTNAIHIFDKETEQTIVPKLD